MKRPIFITTAIFFFTYLVLNPFLYIHFGNSYLVKFGKNGMVEYSPVENNLLVFLTSWFSFAELVPHYSTPVAKALYGSITDSSLTFPTAAITIVAADVVYAFRPAWLRLNICKWKFPLFSPWMVYILAVLSTYTVNWIALQEYHYPITGISIVGFCFLMIYLAATLVVFARYTFNSFNKSARQYRDIRKFTLALQYLRR